MYYVYLIRSLINPRRIYVGYTTNLKERLKDHNAGNSISTAKLCPWHLIIYLAFEGMSKAKSFEKYLKSHAGRTFIQKKFL